MILSHMPLDSKLKGDIAKEGIFTQEGGGRDAFVDRAQMQDEIFELLAILFPNEEQIDLKKFIEIVQNESSEIFLSIMLLLETQIPCSDNFNRYKKKYSEFLDSNADEHDKPKTEQEVRAIASPKLMSKLSPISKMKMMD